MKPAKKLCEKCGHYPRVADPWGGARFRFCSVCLAAVKRAMARDGYLQHVPAPHVKLGEGEV